MHQYELLPSADGVCVKATGSTRAGLLTAAVEGMCAASKPRWEDDAKEATRSFSITTADFPSLLMQLLKETIDAAEINREAYSTVRFTLITDTKAEGAFVGKRVTGFETKISEFPSQTLTIEKNKEGNWETTIELGA